MYSYYYKWDRYSVLHKRRHLLLGFSMGLFIWIWMVIMTGIDTYMVTGGGPDAEPLTSGNIQSFSTALSGIFNPMFAEMVLHRTFANLSWPAFAVAAWAAFMFLGQIIIVYAWYNVWDKLAYRKQLHVVFGLIAGFFGLMAMTMIDAVASYMLTPAEADAGNVARTFLNQTMAPLNMHRFVGNFSYAGFLIAGWGAWRYLRSTREDDREYYDWMGHWGLIWGFGFLILQPVIGYGYLKGIRESSPAAFDTIMLGDKAFLFNLLALYLTIMSLAATAYFVHKLKFAVQPLPVLRKLSIGALEFTALFTILNVIPSDASLVPQIGLVFAGGEETQIPLGAMYPWKYIGLIGMMLVGFFVTALYLRAAATGFRWGMASRWSQYALITCAVTVVLTMVTMSYTRETARRVDNDPGYLIYNCITLQQEVVSENCPAVVEGENGERINTISGERVPEGE